jgi:tetrapyrrole methylase family protein / MazG family protein
MNEFNKLLEIADILLGPNGCPWDKKQTFETLKFFLIEEAYELVDAIDEKNSFHILEEIGDVLYILIFISKIAEKEKSFDISQVIKNISEKLIRRHPHIFADNKINNIDEIIKNWEEIKKTEINSYKRKNLFDELPKSMPFLVKVQKIIKILKRKNIIKNDEKFLSKTDFENQILFLFIKAVNSDLDIESSLKCKLKNLLVENNIKDTGDFLEA